MSLEVYKQGQENSHSLLRRFSQRLRRSRVLLEFRRRQFKKRNRSKTLKKRSALRRKAVREQIEQAGEFKL